MARKPLVLKPRNGIGKATQMWIEYEYHQDRVDALREIIKRLRERLRLVESERDAMRQESFQDN